MTMRNSSIINVLADAANRLKAPHVNNPRLDAEVLLAWVLKTDRHRLYLEKERELSFDELVAYDSAVSQRYAGSPLQYITGFKEFMGLEFAVAPGVLIPRPETEILVEHAALYLSGLNKPRSVLDLGTGSGAIAVCLARLVENVKVYAIDLSETALKTAEGNACRLKVADKITFLKGDLLEPLKDSKFDGLVFDVIVSNPPYIPSGDMSELPADVRMEPETALNGGMDGLDFYRCIIPEALRFLAYGGMLAFEVGAGQAQTVAQIMRDHKYFNINVIKDFSGFERVVSGSFE
jgi:release factor glutamine methyltransferase